MRHHFFEARITPILRAWLVVTPVLPIVAAPEGTALLPLVLNLALCLAATLGFALSAVVHFRRGDERLELLLGGWLALSPWVLGFTWSAAATWNAVACGLTLAGLGLWTALRTAREGPA